MRMYRSLQLIRAQGSSSVLLEYQIAPTRDAHAGASRVVQNELELSGHDLVLLNLPFIHAPLLGILANRESQPLNLPFSIERIGRLGCFSVSWLSIRFYGIRTVAPHTCQCQHM